MAPGILPLSVAAAAWARVALCSDVAGGQEDPLRIELDQGVLRGRETDGLRVFRGIPYAEPPVGEARWRPPQPHKGWKGVLDATDFRAACISPKCWVSEDLTVIDEDCLFINVVAPKSPQLQPVILYIHAGEFHCGTSNDRESRWPIADDVLLVTFNYRIGVFGHLGSEDLRERDPRGGTGNYGVLDQRMAMQWTKKNIRAFGGDPDRITLTGESSGATSVAYHLVAAAGSSSPKESLVSRAILESPGLTQVKTLADAETNYEWVLALLAARRSRGCQRVGGYGFFRSVRLQSFTPGIKLAVHEHETFTDAKAWCDERPSCMGFTRDSRGSVDSFFAGSSLVFAMDVEEFADAAFLSTYLKKGPVEKAARMECLLLADATLLDQLTGVMPRDDTFETDAWAPVIDGVDLMEPIIKSVSNGNIAAGVDILLGSNLDEGTEFMSLTPELACNANQAEFEAWAGTFHGKDLQSEVMRLYVPSALQRPLPACGKGNDPADMHGEEALFYNAAMRSAGDAAIRCPTELVALKAPGNTYMYQFSYTPASSVNWDNTTVMGAFHGAEVPFVFQDEFELSTERERKISRKMGCLWRSFAMHGDPGVEDCGDIKWRMHRTLGHPVLRIGENGGIKFETILEKRQCAIFLRGRHPDLPNVFEDESEFIVV